MRRAVLFSFCLLTCLTCVAGVASAQDPVIEVALQRGPRFLYAASSKETPVRLDVERTPVLSRRITLDLHDVTLEDALTTIARQAGLRLSYSKAVVPLNKMVRLKAEEISVAGAISEVLFDVDVDVLFTANGQAILVPRKLVPEEIKLAGTITGIVTEATTNQPIPQAQVSVVGTLLRSATGEDGRYTIASAPAGQRTVTVRRLGYDLMSQDITVRDGESATLDFVLIRAPTRLAEVVTTVTGGQRRVEMGSAIATISADSLTQIAPVMSFGDLLQGRAPGVMSLQESGISGRAGRIRLRGLNSFFAFSGRNDPIVVVDGIRVEAGAGISSGDGSALSPVGGGQTGRLADFDPDEIANVEVVRGPSAATLYGTDAANGVIIITTKRGHVGPTRWAAFAEEGSLRQRLAYDDQYPDAYYAFGRSTANNAQQRCTLLQRTAGSCVVDSLGTFNTFTDAATKPFKDGSRHQYGLQASGGTSGGTTYFLSGDYERETGTAYMPAVDQALIRTTQGREPPDWQVRPNAFSRVNLRANVMAPLGQRGTATFSTGFVSNRTRQGAGSGDFPGAQVGYRDVNDGWAGSGAVRPAYVFARRNEDVVRRFIGSVATSYSLNDWVALRGTIGADLSTNAFGLLLRRGEASPTSTGSRDANDLAITRYSADFGATATRALSPAVSSKTSVGVQYNRRAQRGSRAFANNLPIGGETLAGATIVFADEATFTTAVAGGYVEEMLRFRDRLFITGAVRFDGGSAFGRDLSVAIYPKAGLSWVLADGQVGPRLWGLSALRLRAAFGASGVQPGPTDALDRVTVVNGFNVAGTATGPVAAFVAGNPNLKPERSSELEAGLDIELWSSRLRVELTGYQRTSKDALVPRPLSPDVAGVFNATVVENLGTVRNRGLELLLSVEALKKRLLAAGFNVTAALNENRLQHLAPGVVLSSPVAEGTRQEIGYPVFGLWGFRIQSAIDANANGIIEPTEIVFSGPNSSFIGSPVPLREATATPYLKAFGERLHLSAQLQYRGGFRRGIGVCNPCGRPFNDETTPLNEQAEAVALGSLGRSGPLQRDASYLVLRELSLGVALPPVMTRRLRAGGGRLVLAGRNLALLWQAGPVPFENLFTNQDNASRAATTFPASSTYWLFRLNLTY